MNTDIWINAGINRREFNKKHLISEVTRRSAGKYPLKEDICLLKRAKTKRFLRLVAHDVKSYPHWFWVIHHEIQLI